MEAHIFFWLIRLSDPMLPFFHDISVEVPCAGWNPQWRSTFLGSGLSTFRDARGGGEDGSHDVTERSSFDKKSAIFGSCKSMTLRTLSSYGELSSFCDVVFNMEGDIQKWKAFSQLIALHCDEMSHSFHIIWIQFQMSSYSCETTVLRNPKTVQETEWHWYEISAMKCQ